MVVLVVVAVTVTVFTRLEDEDVTVFGADELGSGLFRSEELGVGLSSSPTSLKSFQEGLCRSVRLTHVDQLTNLGCI